MVYSCSFILLCMISAVSYINKLIQYEKCTLILIIILHLYFLVTVWDKYYLSPKIIIIIIIIIAIVYVCRSKVQEIIGKYSPCPIFQC